MSLLKLLQLLPRSDQRFLQPLLISKCQNFTLRADRLLLSDNCVFTAPVLSWSSQLPLDFNDLCLQRQGLFLNPCQLRLNSFVPLLLLETFGSNLFDLAEPATILGLKWHIKALLFGFHLLWLVQMHHFNDSLLRLFSYIHLLLYTGLFSILIKRHQLIQSLQELIEVYMPRSASNKPERSNFEPFDITRLNNPLLIEHFQQFKVVA